MFVHTDVAERALSLVLCQPERPLRNPRTGRKLNTSPHADVTVGAPPASNGDCIPFGCNFFDFDETFDYQQVYGSTNFSRPITITDLEFFNTVDFSGGGTEPQAGSYVLFLSSSEKRPGPPARRPVLH